MAHVVVVVVVVMVVSNGVLVVDGNCSDGDGECVGEREAILQVVSAAAAVVVVVVPSVKQ